MTRLGRNSPAQDSIAQHINHGSLFIYGYRFTDFPELKITRVLNLINNVFKAVFTENENHTESDVA